LVFDSWLQPLPAGVRSGSRESRQAIYRVGEYYVYIRVEKQLESQLLSLVGQVANETLPQQPMKSVAVALRCGEETLIQSVSNEHGEFQFEYEPKRRLHLWVGLTDRNIDVPLSRFSTWKG